MDERKLGDVPVADINQALLARATMTGEGGVKESSPARRSTDVTSEAERRAASLASRTSPPAANAALDQVELERPPWPYTKCRECDHDLDEHDDGIELHKCHVPGCTCGMNRW